jgi:3-carboxy-cis,cis-muconate cycloisomerase
VRTAREQGRPLAEVLAARDDVDLASLGAGPDVGEAGAQVDAVLAEHAALADHLSPTGTEEDA